MNFDIGTVAEERPGAPRGETLRLSAVPALPAASLAQVLYALVRQLRPRQWTKNLVCLAGLIFSGLLFHPSAIARALLAVLVFCCVASAIYILNDALDLKRDRTNPRTARRPLASGVLPLWIAALAGYVFLVAGILTAFSLGHACGVVVVLYLLINLLYCFGLKHQVVADVMCIALGFVLRVLLGVYAVGVLPTVWIVTCMFFLALFLGFAKRRAERASLEADSPHARPVLQKYQIGYLDILLAMSATITILCYALFTVTSQKNPTLIITVLPVVYCITHYLMHVMSGGRAQSPEELLLSDRALWLGVLAWVGLCVLILYLDVHLFVEAFPR